MDTFLRTRVIARLRMVLDFYYVTKTRKLVLDYYTAVHVTDLNGVRDAGGLSMTISKNFLKKRRKKYVLIM